MYNHVRETGIETKNLCLSPRRFMEDPDGASEPVVNSAGEGASEALDGQEIVSAGMVTDNDPPADVEAMDEVADAEEAAEEPTDTTDGADEQPEVELTSHVHDAGAQGSGTNAAAANESTDAEAGPAVGPAVGPSDTDVEHELSDVVTTKPAKPTQRQSGLPRRSPGAVTKHPYGVAPVPKRRQELPSRFSQAPSAAGPSVGGSHESSLILNSAIAAEQVAREKLRRLQARVQRELRRASSMSAVEGIREKKRQEVAEMRADLDQRVGRDLTRRLREDAVEAASKAEMVELSKLMNERLATYHPAAGRNAFTLFKQMDVDGSRRVSFKEFTTLLRDQLRLRSSDLPASKLHGLWKALDENASGFVDAGELGRFMKLGRPEVETSARSRMAVANHTARRSHLADLDKRAGRDLTAQLREADVPAASEAEILEMSALFNAQMAAMRPRDSDGLNFFQLFKHMDVDGSGRISFRELTLMVRMRPGSPGCLST